MTSTPKPPVELTDAQFQMVSRLVKDKCGIHLHDGKKKLVKARLAKRLRALGLNSFRQYLTCIEEDPHGDELAAMLDVISTNHTFFFREKDHFTYLVESALPAIVRRHQQDRRLRIWSAGCSSGEEPYSIGMTLREELEDTPGWDARILATDISRPVLTTAYKGLYPAQKVQALGLGRQSRWFERVGHERPYQYRIATEVRSLVHFAHLNLMQPWPMSGPFDIIFCRNVMIYFDRATRETLLAKFWAMLDSGGFFFVGHSESLAGIDHSFQYVKPAVYVKP